MTFTDFKQGPARSVFAALGGPFGSILSEAESYEELRSEIIAQNDPDVGRFVKAVRRYAGVCSSGEFRLLLAICAFADFGHVADEMSAGTAWQNISRGCDRRFRAAIAACVMESP
jgi:hypothetical protein